MCRRCCWRRVVAWSQGRPSVAAEDLFGRGVVAQDQDPRCSEESLLRRVPFVVGEAVLDGLDCCRQLEPLVHDHLLPSQR